MNNLKIDRRVLGLALVCGLAVAAGTAVAGVVVVAHPSVAATKVTTDELQGIFLGKTTSWSDGSAAKPAVLVSGPTLDEFLKIHIKKSSSQFSTFWKKAVFSGTGNPPSDFKTEAELLEYVAKTPGAIGFVTEGTGTGGTKILATQ